MGRRNQNRRLMHHLTGHAVLLAAFAWPALAEAHCSPDRVDLRWDGGGESFAVELADDAAERAQGLMFREALDPAAGMLFVYESPRRAQFWMKNTLIPLDMIFADARGVVTTVHANAVPQDLTPIDGGEGVALVLEINGGLAAKLGITPGAELRHPAIAAANAVWPCDG
ncbi:MAG: hypothetical protein B7Y02_08595 [Rhodobacterales bacterium 17-64-5]|nr:MAG: hypothetical protein B7Y02_08595 [Rhodobacterales bacterium 17-64-5]